MKEMELKYGCNPNQKPSRIFMEEGELKHSPVIQAVYDLVRAKVPTVEKDRHFYPDIMDINELLVSGKVIDCAEEISGKLKF